MRKYNEKDQAAAACVIDSIDDELAYIFHCIRCGIKSDEKVYIEDQYMKALDILCAFINKGYCGYLGIVEDYCKSRYDEITYMRSIGVPLVDIVA